MIILLAIVAATVSQGDLVNITLLSDANVTLPDCMFFVETMTSSAELPKGNHTIYVTHSCEGEQKVEVYSGDERETIPVFVERSSNVTKVEELLIDVMRERLSLESERNYLRRLVDAINSMNVELYNRYLSCRNENQRLSEQLEVCENQAGNCSKLLEDARDEIELLRNTIDKMSVELSAMEANLSELSGKVSKVESFAALFRGAFVFVLAVLVGLLFAIARR
ncbi:MAG: hypothetical protein ABWW66_00985 [Archaeoglobaceae archaeon]